MAKLDSINSLRRISDKEFEEMVDKATSYASRPANSALPISDRVWKFQVLNYIAYLIRHDEDDLEYPSQDILDAIEARYDELENRLNLEQ